MNKNFYCAPVELAAGEIKVNAYKSEIKYTFKISETEQSFIESSSKPMAFVKDVFGVQLLLLFTEGTGELFIPESYSNEERTALSNFFSHFIN